MTRMMRFHRPSLNGVKPRNEPSREEANFRELFENASDFIYATDLAGNLTLVNRAAERITGYTKKELVGTNLGQIVAPESLAAVLRTIDHVARGMGPVTHELEVVARDGRKVPLEANTRLIYEDGRPAGLQGIARDVSLRLQADRKIQERAVHLEALNAVIAAADSAPDLSQLLAVAIDRTLEVLGLGMGGIWAGDHHVVRGVSPEIGTAVVEAGRGADEKTSGSSAVIDWEMLSRGGSNSVAAKWLHVGIRASLTVPIVAEGRCIGALVAASAYPRSWTRDEVDLAEAIAQQVAATAEGLRLFQETQERAMLMGRLVSLGDSLNRPAALAGVAEAVGQAAQALSGSLGAALYLRWPDGTFTCPWSKGVSPEHTAKVLTIGPVQPARHKAGSTAPAQPGAPAQPAAVDDRAGEMTQPSLFSDVLTLPPDHGIRLLAEHDGYRAVGVWPIVYEERVIAAAWCHYDEPHAWSRSEQEIFQTFTRQAASALENGRLHHNLEEAYIQMVVALARAMDAKDAYTGNHSERLATLVDDVALEMDLPEEEVKDIRWAALLHDIGKIGAPDHILCKPGPLTDEEWAIMRKHPVIGEQILLPVARMRGVAKIVRHHQEKWDGTGYPDGLRHDAIPLGSRILAVVDSYSAIVDERPYKRPRTRTEAETELTRCAGAHFDPKVVEFFIRVLNHGRRGRGNADPPRFADLARPRHHHRDHTSAVRGAS